MRAAMPLAWPGRKSRGQWSAPPRVNQPAAPRPAGSKPPGDRLYIQDIVSEPGRIVLNYGQSWPIVTLNTVNPIAITYICGYSDVSAIPESIKQGMKIDISDMYEHREPRILGAGTMIEIPILSRLYSDYVDWTFKI